MTALAVGLLFTTIAALGFALLERMRAVILDRQLLAALETIENLQNRRAALHDEMEDRIEHRVLAALEAVRPKPGTPIVVAPSSPERRIGETTAKASSAMRDRIVQNIVSEAKDQGMNISEEAARDEAARILPNLWPVVSGNATSR